MSFVAKKAAFGEVVVLVVLVALVVSDVANELKQHGKVGD